MIRLEAEQKLKELYRGRQGLRDAFHEESSFVDFHIKYTLEQCGGTWDNQVAVKFITLIQQSQ